MAISTKNFAAEAATAAARPKDGDGDGERERERCTVCVWDLKSELLIVCSDSSAKDHSQISMHWSGSVYISMLVGESVKLYALVGIPPSSE